MDRYPRSDSIVQGRTGLQTYMAQVYGWMTVGLLLTAFIAWFAGEYPGGDDVRLFEQNHFLRADYCPAGAGVCAVGDGAAAERRDGHHAVYALLGADRADAVEHFIAYTYSSIASTFVVTGGCSGR
ncbi:integral membrane protein [Klebsiella aerogenes]|nr:integral membrane protein [Klebsiella aerogenes]